VILYLEHLQSSKRTGKQYVCRLYFDVTLVADQMPRRPPRFFPDLRRKKGFDLQHSTIQHSQWVPLLQSPPSQWHLLPHADSIPRRQLLHRRDSAKLLRKQKQHRHRSLRLQHPTLNTLPQLLAHLILRLRGRHITPRSQPPT
jgi:hypothetical protein